jgi:hypothetical protein
MLITVKTKNDFGQGDLTWASPLTGFWLIGESPVYRQSCC